MGDSCSRQRGHCMQGLGIPCVLRYGIKVAWMSPGQAELTSRCQCVVYLLGCCEHISLHLHVLSTMGIIMVSALWGCIQDGAQTCVMCTSQTQAFHVGKDAEYGQRVRPLEEPERLAQSWGAQSEGSVRRVLWLLWRLCLGE